MIDHVPAGEEPAPAFSFLYYLLRRAKAIILVYAPPSHDIIP